MPSMPAIINIDQDDKGGRFNPLNLVKVCGNGNASSNTNVKGPFKVVFILPLDLWILLLMIID